MAGQMQTLDEPFVEQGLRRIRVHPVRRHWVYNKRTGIGYNSVVGEQYDPVLHVIHLCQYDTSYVIHYRHPWTVRCQVLGLFFMGTVTVWPDNTGTITYHHLGADMNAYWRDRARAQFGTHVCMNRVGQLHVVDMWATNANPAPGAAGGRGVKHVSLHQLYPCVRGVDRGEVMAPGLVPAGNEELHDEHYMRHLRPYQLTIGLSYRSLIGDINDPIYDPPYNAGDRYFVRQEIPVERYQWGQVWEVTGGSVGPELERLTNMIDPEPYFAIYVCAGAKLVVNDEYNDSVNDRQFKHQRTLVQQGGVAIVEGELIMRPPSLDLNLRFNVNQCGLDECPLQAAYGIHNDMIQLINCPVLFLAPNESEYGSVAWELTIARSNLNENDEREYRLKECALVAPDGGRIEAIVEWAGERGGAAELAARHQYERLYESCVQMANNREYMGQQFACPPDRILMNRILKNTQLGADRTVNVHIEANAGNIFAANRQDDHQPLPVVYNTHRVLSWLNGNERLDEPPPMAPEFPLLQLYDTNEKVFAPHTGDPIGYGYSWVTGRVWPTPYLYRVKDDGQYVQLFEPRGKLTRTLYPYERQPFQTRPEDLCDGHNAYVGIDGWVYKKVNDTELGKCESVYYSGR